MAPEKNRIICLSADSTANFGEEEKKSKKIISCLISNLLQ